MNTLAAAMPQIVWGARPDGLFDYYNRRWYEFTGRPEGPGGDGSWSDVVHPDDQEESLARWQSAIRSGDAYEIERQPITDQVSRFAMDHAQQMIKARGAVPPRIEDPGAEGDAIRADAGRKAYELNVQQFCCAGLNFGYFYEQSPLIDYDGEAPPAYTMGSFTASTVPGCRAPHFRLGDGRSLYDAFGSDYTLLRFDAVYHGHFKCNVRRIIDYPRLWAFARRIYQIPQIKGTVSFAHISSP